MTQPPSNDIRTATGTAIGAPATQATENLRSEAYRRIAMEPLILIAEDESSIAEVVRYNLEKEGFRTAVASDGEEAMMAISEHKPDLLLLDWMLPLVSGLEICRQLRRSDTTRDIPIIMLTARTEEADRVRGLNSGADDYVVKPFSPNELVARVRALLRRSTVSARAEELSFGDLKIDLAAHRVTRGSRSIHLGPTEYRLLKHFLSHKGRVFSREQLLDAVWGRDVYVEPRTVDVHIRRLRKAVNGKGETDIIRTVRSAGYALAELAE